jgi:hypothetical protein
VHATVDRLSALSRTESVLWICGHSTSKARDSHRLGAENPLESDSQSRIFVDFVPWARQSRPSIPGKRHVKGAKHMLHCGILPNQF